MGARLDCVVFDLDGTLIAPGRAVPVPGIEHALSTLARDGVALAVATSAVPRVARRVLAETGLDRWFASVAGGDGSAGKDAIVAEALLGLGRPLPDGAPGVAVVGDGAADMAAAVGHDLLAVGAAWSGASERGLRAAGAVVVLHDPGDLPDTLRDP